MTDGPPKQIKRLKKEIEIAASPAAVWKALTDVEELARWFPLSARVTPGAEGSIFLSWGPGCEGEARITGWEPQKLLRLIEQAGGVAGPEGVTIEWKLEPAGGGTTVVRLVQSGFSAGGEWADEYFASTEYGWGFMLLNLRHYLERHAGTPRRVAWPRIKVSMSREEAYRRLAEPGGLFREGAAGLVAGADYMLEAATGENFEGRVEFVRPPRGFCIGVRELNDALVWLTIEGTGGEHDVQLWLSSYGVPQAKVESFEREWGGVLGRIFGAGTKS
ncbi:MAG TPA: SRPBCC domain-containing protein [Candidatus Acidoferrales bacterium]|nr:SRPBCC domain-containing protein [Candidatus Acidoferrales bacterium]